VTNPAIKKYPRKNLSLTNQEASQTEWMIMLKNLRHFLHLHEKTKIICKK
jgi:hypothetical protein